MDKDTRKVVQAAIQQGFETKTTSDGHVRLYRNGVFAGQASGTPSDVRSIRNLTKSLQRHGLIWPPPGKGRR